MLNVLLNDCDAEITERFRRILGNSAAVTSLPFSSDRRVTDYHLAALYAGSGDGGEILNKIKQLRFMAKFRNIPIILLTDELESFSNQPYFHFGASDVLSLAEPPPVFKQILLGYLSPGRRPLEKERTYLKPFIRSTVEVLRKMADLEAEFKGVYFKNDLRILGDVSGVIGLSGPAEGTVTVTFLWDLAKIVVSRTVGVEAHEINAEIIHDGVGEIINMISGSAKADLADTPYYFHISVPTIVVGWGHEIGHPEKASIAVLLFDVGDKAFVLHVSLTPTVQ